MGLSNHYFRLLIRTSAKAKGIAMVEVLITTTITAIGILAVILLISNLKTSSVVSKQRVEALSLAVTKIAHFQNMLDYSQYLSITSAKDEKIDGANGIFFRSWEIESIEQSKAKKIKLQVTWSGERGEEEQVQLNTIINWNDPLKSASISSYGVDMGFVYLSPNKNIQVGDQTELKLPDNAITTPMPHQMKKYTDQQGILYLLDKDNHILLTISAESEEKDSKFYEISGTVYYPSSLVNELKILASDASYCLFPLEEKSITASSWKSANYYCVTSEGWKGKIGILNTNSSIEEKITCPSRSREYLHYTLLAGQLFQSGINQSYKQQDFIIDSNFNTNTKSCFDLALDIQSLAIEEAINAENHTILESTDVNTLSGYIKLSDPSRISRIELAIDNKLHDCRLLNKLDLSNDAYSCVVEVKNPSVSSWSGLITGKAFLNDLVEISCQFSVAFSGNSQSIILDLDIDALCQ